MAANTGIFHQCETTLAVHVELRTLLICDYLATNPLRERFRLSCRADLPLSMIQEQSIEKILDFLEAKGLFSEGNYRYVKEKSADVHVYIIELIRQAEARIMEIRENALLFSTFVTDVHPSHLEKETNERVEAILLAVLEFIICNANRPYADIPALYARFSDLQTMSNIFLDIWHGEFCKCRKNFGQRMLLQFIASAAIDLSYGDDQFEHFKKNIFPYLGSTLRKSASSIFHFFNDCGAIPVSGVQSSVLSYWIFDSVRSLDTLWDKYKKGDLDAVLQKCFNSREALCLLNVEKVSLRMEIRNEDYLQYRTKLEAKGIVSEGYLKGIEKKAADVQVKIIESTPRAGDRIKEIREARGREREKTSNDLLTEGFLAELSRKIGSEWILVCVALGIPQSELDHIIYDASFDVQTKIYRGLLRWNEKSQRTSERELINELMDALIQNGRHDLVDFSPEVFGTSVDPPVIRKTSLDTDFREKLWNHNHYETQRIPVSPLQKTGVMPIEELFAPISVREDLEYQGKGRNIGMQSKRTKPVSSPDDMFLINDIMARNVFMLGEAGIGKSVFCLRLVENWCKAHDQNVSERELGSWEKALKQFDFLFSVPLRHIDKSRISTVDMICRDVFQRHPECHDVIRRVISDERYRCLIVIDGLDEWKISDDAKRKLKVEGIPNTDNMANCTILWSMRPWAMDKFSDMIRGNDRVIEIQGLESKSVDIVIEKILVNFYDLDETSSQYRDKITEIKDKLQSFELKSVMQIPLVTIACVQIWYEGQNVGNSMTSLYEGLLDLLVRRANQRSPFPPEIMDRLPSIKEKLGEIAYNDLLSNETHLVFRKDDLERKLESNELDFALKTGLLSNCEAPGSFNEENVSVNFFHKSMQEFLAAIFLYNRADREMTCFYEHLSSVEAIMELGNVLLFLSGLSPTLGSEISQHIVNVANADTEICDRYRAFNDVVHYRNKKVELLYKLQAGCFREIKNTRTDGTQLVSYHVSDVHIDNKSDLGTIRATADILTHHHADIRSLMIDIVPTDEINGIPDSLLIQFLDQTLSLQTLYLDRRNTSRALEKISDSFSLLTTMIFHDVTLTNKAISKLQTVLKSNKVLQSLGLFNIKCPADKGKGHKRASKQGVEPASLSGVLHIVPDISNLSTLDIQVSNNADKPALYEAMKWLSHLHGIWYHGTHPRDEEFDRERIQTLCTYHDLHLLYLGRLSLGDDGIRISHHMAKLATISLFRVDMSPLGWDIFIESVVNMEHKCDVYLNELYLDEKCLTKILSSPQFHVTRNIVYNDGDLEDDFDLEAVGIDDMGENKDNLDNITEGVYTQATQSSPHFNEILYVRQPNDEVREAQVKQSSSRDYEVMGVSKVSERGAGGRRDLYFTKTWPH